MQLFENELAVKHILNNNCDAILKYLAWFPSVFVLNYFAHVIIRNLLKYTSKLTSINTMKSIEKELNQLGDLAYE